MRIQHTGVGVEFLLLGAVRAVRNARLVHLGPRQQRLVFAVLAWEVGRPVSVDRLISLLWPVSPPRTAEHAVRVCVSRLRSILAGHAELTAQGGGYVRRERQVRHAARVAAQTGERRLEGPALIRVGNHLQCRGRLVEASAYYQQALELSCVMGERHAEANALHFLGGVEYLMGELDAALDHDSEALRIYLSLGGRNDEARARTHLANVHRASGRCDAAMADARAALVLALETGERRTETWVRSALAATHLLAMGDTGEAAAEYERSLAVARAIGARHEECEALIADKIGYRLLADQAIQAGATREDDRLRTAGDLALVDDP
ncbi:tetratricopeptide repeat protein [Kibdelosporangium phytohabitans]|uniref:tetratricopeptide repeat protein n=1 Tax=Kibdelosporangium phytohabitans TaxID=860235 RepID=UPI000A88FB0D|nr:tetratricopeptide repeat protein [Kibdelosporangium phytohabitans]MBE1468382.1 tetratricopeptide (TPR) repeat protein [Kibdelosporangium phytohabitans]